MSTLKKKTKEYGNIHNKYEFGDKNEESKTILNFVIGYELITADTFLRKRRSM